jgi:hypothetical protein
MRDLERGEKASQQSVSAIMLTPLLVLVLVMVFSAVGSALAGS